MAEVAHARATRSRPRRAGHAQCRARRRGAGRSAAVGRRADRQRERSGAASAPSTGCRPCPKHFAAAASARFGCAVIVTLGPRGALAARGRRAHRDRSASTRVVDTTGAGDAFAGALAAALDRGATPAYRAGRGRRRRFARLRAATARRQRSRSAARSRRWQQHSDTVFISSPTEGPRTRGLKCRTAIPIHEMNDAPADLRHTNALRRGIRRAGAAAPVEARARRRLHRPLGDRRRGRAGA